MECLGVGRPFIYLDSNDVLGIRTWDRTMVGADESTGLWRPPSMSFFKPFLCFCPPGPLRWIRTRVLMADRRETMS